MKRLVLVLILFASTVFAGSVVDQDTIIYGGGASGNVWAGLLEFVNGYGWPGTAMASDDTIRVIIRGGWTAHDDNIHFDLDGGGYVNGYIEVVVEGLARHNGTWCDTCYVFESQTTNNAAMDWEEGSWTFDGVQFDAHTGNRELFMHSDLATMDSLAFDACIFNVPRYVYYSNRDLLSLRSIYFRNCAFVDTAKGDSSQFIRLAQSNYLHWYIYNCTAANHELLLHLQSSETYHHVTMKNTLTAALVYPAVDSQAVFGIIANVDSTHIEYCASDDSTAGWDRYQGGTGNRFDQTFTFENSANSDYRITSADGGAKDYGTDLGADGNMAFDDDCVGTDRDTYTPWDIGWFEVGAEEEAQNYRRRRIILQQ